MSQSNADLISNINKFLSMESSLINNLCIRDLISRFRIIIINGLFQKNLIQKIKMKSIMLFYLLILTLLQHLNNYC